MLVGKKNILYFSAWFLSCCLCSINCNWKMKMLLRWAGTSSKSAKSFKWAGWIICISWLFWSYFGDNCNGVIRFCVSYLISYLSYLFSLFFYLHMQFCHLCSVCDSSNCIIHSVSISFPTVLLAAHFILIFLPLFLCSISCKAESVSPICYPRTSGFPSHCKAEMLDELCSEQLLVFLFLPKW